MNDYDMNDAELQQYVYGPEGSVEPRFGNDVMSKLAQSFDIPAIAITETKAILEMVSPCFMVYSIGIKYSPNDLFFLS